MIILVVLAGILGSQGNAQNCQGYEDHPLVLVSLDGFRVEYLTRGLTPNIQALRDGGVSPPYMKASYPTVTFPNHYTIVTGLYPESHGIIANSFYDSTFKAEFSLGSEESLQGRWWGGAPIWNTVVKQSKRSATFFWPGSDADIEEMHPTYYYTYDGSIEYSVRIDQVLSWLSLPAPSRPHWMCVYFDEPDHTGHYLGPNSQEVNDKLVEVDGVIEQLVSGIADLGLRDCVNIILLADHGMTDAGKERVIELTDYVPDLEDLGVTYQGAFVRIDVDEEDKDETEAMRRNLTCQRPELRQYTPEDLPTRFHFTNNIRIEDIVLDLSLGFTGNANSGWYMAGDHGYDNYYQDMQPIFIANGPDFLSGVQVEPFQNIEVYNLMCHLVGVVPAPNNGTEGALYHLLQSPPKYPSLIPEPSPPSPSYPSEDGLSARQHISGCLNDDNSPLSLNMSSEEKDGLVQRHLPWGTPYSAGLHAHLLMLHHDDHVTGYSQTLKMPLWTSFTLDDDVTNVLPSYWSSDVRLTSQNSVTCHDYETLSTKNITMQPLFPNRFGGDPASSEVTFMVSNAVPMTDELIVRWQYLVDTLLSSWVINWDGPINVVTGPLFDNDADSYVDDFTLFQSIPTVPSDLFMIVTRCLDQTSNFTNCHPEHLDAIAFIFPEIIDINNCMTMSDFALDFSAKVKDVQIATGLTFYPSLTYGQMTRLALRIHSSLWKIS